ncbi:hypothetical protein AGABI2DRAFT_67658 [Agaricus bisporus var. bisporus H97]|uniref:hypothetical protein n=1 Tax=Agaricus bisporus var. bisporus (strain H97 / ATCC MYA-4626 / FGSC 10389) TaxID=936046 RepID=UPI00029F7379|nr:hypothetical protein AGABI2DRAFT_67658 [Agaricus bisporus var. bisporus H97]EKV47887.1 hypothetical protein AGABI2DRAFT_67658 [Agaricus bisporus var. bisporus H97]
MAEDVICLLDHVGWTEEKGVHVVGISLGGMIAQELAWRIPERIGSLVLAVTTPGGWFWNNIPPWKGAMSLTKLMMTPDPLMMAPIVADMLYTQDWLKERDIDEPNKTNRQVQQEAFLRRVAITKKQRLKGHVSQMVAGLTHHVSAERLRQIGEGVGRVAIVVGDEDHLVWREGSRRLKEGMGKVVLEEWRNTGHGIHVQRWREFNQLVERTIRTGARGV